ncbi:hypothetical protein DUHN55_24350 [Helicobacter pylori]
MPWSTWATMATLRMSLREIRGMLAIISARGALPQMDEGGTLPLRPEQVRVFPLRRTSCGRSGLAPIKVAVSRHPDRRIGLDCRNRVRWVTGAPVAARSTPLGRI